MNISDTMDKITNEIDRLNDQVEEYGLIYVLKTYNNLPREFYDKWIISLFLFEIKLNTRKDNDLTFERFVMLQKPSRKIIVEYLQKMYESGIYDNIPQIIYNICRIKDKTNIYYDVKLSDIVSLES
jgi:hypothetical protein